MQSAQRLRFWERHLLSGTSMLVDGSAEMLYARPDRPLSMDGQEGEIQRDLNRTFPTHPLFSEPGGSGQLALGRILFALLQRFPHIGYTQGMNFVVGVFMIVATAAACARQNSRTKDALSIIIDAPTESRVFCLMCSLITSRKMALLWSPGTPDLKLRIFQLEGMLQKKLPKLHAHMHDIGLMPDFFASKWFITLHSYSLPLQALCIVWDAWVCDGWKAIFRGGLALLLQRRDHLLTLDMGEMAMMFNRKLGLPKSPQRPRRVNRANLHHYAAVPGALHHDYEPSTSGFLNAYSRIKITRRSLTRLEHLYKQSRLFGMMEWAVKQRENRRKTTPMRLREAPSKVDWSMSAYDDPSAPASFGPSAVSFIRTQFNKLEDDIELDSKILRERLEQVARSLRRAEAAYRISLHNIRELESDLADADERKELLSAQFVSFVSTTDAGRSGVAGRRRPLRSDLSVLQDKIETATRLSNALREQLAKEKGTQQLLRLDLEDAKDRKDAASHQLVARIEANDEMRGALAIALFEQFNLT